MSAKWCKYLGCKVKLAALVVVKLANGLATNSIVMSNIKTDFSSELVFEIGFQLLKCKAQYILSMLFLAPYKPCIDW